jgi:acyl-CoA thioester hydrolase
MYSKNIEVRWSDLDPNFHMLHSKYYDIGAYCRIAFLTENGLTQQMLSEFNIGPILFREEAIFKKEIKFQDKVEVDLTLTRATKDFARWSMVHQIWRNEELAAIITVDGAWIDTKLRKLAIPPPVIQQVFTAAPHSPDLLI